MRLIRLQPIKKAPGCTSNYGEKMAAKPVQTLIRNPMYCISLHTVHWCRYRGYLQSYLVKNLQEIWGGGGGFYETSSNVPLNLGMQ